MARVYVNFGSNYRREYYLQRGLDALAALVGELTLSTVYESEAVGFDGANFFNLVAGFETDLPVGELSKSLKAIEDDNDRVRGDSKFSGRTLDIDILLYNDLIGDCEGVQLPRAEIVKNAFVLKPLVDVAADLIHPIEKQSYQQLWALYDKQSQPLTAVDFSWQGLQFSVASNGTVGS